MSNKELQRVTECVSDIGQAPARHTLPARRHHSVHDDDHPAGIFLRIKGSDCSSELIGLYDVLARLMSIALQYGAPLEKFGDLLAGAKFEPCGPISGHDRLKHYSSLRDLIGRHLLVQYWRGKDLAHVHN